MPRRRVLPLLALAASCGGGGGSVVVTPAGPTASLAAADVEIGPAVAAADVTVRLASSPELAPSLLQVAVALPPQLVLPANDRLQAAVPLATLDGGVVGDRFVVLCGDAHNPGAAPLALGPLFRLRLQPASPRQPGTYTVRFENVRAATRTGEAVPVDPAPVTATVVVR